MVLHYCRARDRLRPQGTRRTRGGCAAAAAAAASSSCSSAAGDARSATGASAAMMMMTTTTTTALCGIGNNDAPDERDRNAEDDVRQQQQQPGGGGGGGSASEPKPSRRRGRGAKSTTAANKIGRRRTNCCRCRGCSCNCSCNCPPRAAPAPSQRPLRHRLLAVLPLLLLLLAALVPISAAFLAPARSPAGMRHAVVPVEGQRGTDSAGPAAAAFAVAPAAPRVCRRHRTPSGGRSSTALNLHFPLPNGEPRQKQLAEPTLDKERVYSANSNSDGRIPFLIERVPEYAPDKMYVDIASMCIEAFFNDSGDGGRAPSAQSRAMKVVPPWKAAQLAYLRALQTGDLKARRRRDDATNFMFVARRVVPDPNDYDVGGSGSSGSSLDRLLSNPVILPHHESVYNLDDGAVDGDVDGEGRSYVRGEILGFVEVTKREYGIPDTADGQGGQAVVRSGVRPVLTNLSVCAAARKSGLGSALLRRCEEEVSHRWNMDEIILEVEDDNVAAQKFYEKRGYVRIFDDPASRRYDLSFLWLREVRCRRIIMRKRGLRMPSFLSQSPDCNNSKKSGSSPFDWALQKLRENVFAGIR